MSVYVSTSSKRIERAREVIAYLKAKGFRITHDWTVGFDDEASYTDEELSRRAAADVRGARAADFVIVIMLKEMSIMTGAAVEIGAALAVGTPVVIVEEEIPFEHFFKHHENIVRVPSLEAALAWEAS